MSTKKTKPKAIQKTQPIDPTDFITLDAKFNMFVNSNKIVALKRIAEKTKGSPSVAQLLRMHIDDLLNKPPSQKDIFGDQDLESKLENNKKGKPQ